VPRLSNIAITHISLVKEVANKNSIIYKSSDKEPEYIREIAFKKSDDEKGIVYGIVYAPEQKDTDGDFASSDEIIKAAYSFMKERNTINVDKQHSFENVDAFVAESWIVKENDSVFPNEPVGSWAVAIKLESEELKKAVKDGDIAGLSMAGTAIKKEDNEPTQKADDKTFSLNDLIDMFKKVFGSTHVNISGSAYSDVNKSNEGDKEEMKKEEIEKALADALEPLKKEIGDLKTKNESLEKSNKTLEETLKKSKQDNDPAVKVEKKETSIKGIM
jgi:hypothetical protein